MKYSNQKITAGILAALMSCASFVSCGSETDNWTETAGSPAAEAEATSPAGTNDVSAAEFPWTESRHRLQFGEDGEFKVLVLSDLHIGGSISGLAKENMELLVEREQPDLVIFDGDNTWGLSTENDVKKAVSSMVRILEDKKIPWGHVYGNHDCEGSNLNKKKQQEIYESFEYCVSQAGPEELYGQGNYVLPVYGYNSDKVLFNVWALDSGEYLTTAQSAELMPVATTYQGYAGSIYDYIKPSQVQWYMETSAAMEAYNGAVVPGMMAFHIPLQESYNAWLNREALNHTGEKREVACASEINSGLFAAMVERGDIKAVVNGHDHRNDYMVEYGGIKLCYCSTISETGYCDMDMLGGRVFLINEKDPADVQTYMTYIDESKMTGVTEVIDADPIPEGVVLDFDSYTPEMTKTGWPSDTSDAAKVDSIVAEIAGEKGLDGTAALGVTRKNFGTSNTENNTEIRIPLETPGLLGENKYIRVWMDLGANSVDVDFRKACFGLIENNVSALPYATDENDKNSPFWYLPDGGTEWKRMMHGNDGCFGSQQDSSVKGLKGWFAFPVDQMLRRSSYKAPDADTYVTHIYFYFSLTSANMKNCPVYIDDISLVKEYRFFE